MDLLEMPVTLVVKAPNQKVADHTVECGLDWTIKKLKEHLSTAYPSKPREHQQKLIYSGKLLHDHLQLKDVLRQYEENQNTHTVHLVCSTPQEKTSIQQTVPTVQTSQEQVTLPTNESQGPNLPSNLNDGVRHRHTHTSGMQPPMQAPQEAFQQFYPGNPMMMYGGAMYPGMMGMSPEQMFAMQQMYAQQMAQYMQLYQQHNMVPYGTPLHGPEVDATVPAAQVPQPVAPAPAPAQQPAQRAGEPIQRMNAQGGVVFDDDEDEGNRDWLDWVYTLSRLGVLLGIVYFYSTLSRFFMVFSFFTFVYMYQRGWFQVRRRNVAPAPAPAEDPQPPAPQPAQPDQPTPEQQQQEEDPNPTDSEGDAEMTDDASSSEPAPPAAPGALTIAWSFFTTFFSSLIPQQPPGLNGN